MPRLTTTEHWKTGIGQKVFIRHAHGELEGYFVCKCGTAKRKLNNVDEGARNCGELADSMGLNKIGYVAHLDVEDAHQGEGIGGALLDEFVMLSKIRKAEYVLLVANPTDPSLWDKLISFYRRHDFKLNKHYENIMYQRLRHASGRVIE